MTVWVTLSLVAQNQRADLARLLPGLLAAAARLPSEILLVDNRSTDGTLAYLGEQFPTVGALFNPGQAGYGENHNLNLARARGDYFVVMNCDMMVPPDIFVQLHRYMENNPDVGIVSPQVLNPDGTIQGLNKRHPTLLDLFLRRFVPRSFHRRVRERADYYEMRDMGYDHLYDVPFLSGAFMFCRTELLRSLKGFDPGYFLYFEDVDLCRRVQQTHRTVYFPGTSVIHFWERAAHRHWRYAWYFARSAVRYFGRWGYRLA